MSLPPSVRSLLFVPANRPDLIKKAGRWSPDAVILDLEDAVPVGEKAHGRNAVATHMAVQGTLPLLVRTRDAHSPDFRDDLLASVGPGLSAILLPQVRSPQDVIVADSLLLELERERGLNAGSISLIPMAESALGIHNIFEILRAVPRVVAAAFAGADGGDLALDLGCQSPLAGHELLYARSKVLLEARAAGLSIIIDGVYPDLDNPAGFRTDAVRARQMGYTARFAVHPRQVDIIHDVFSYTQQQITEARRVLAAYEQAASSGHGAARLDGRLLDDASRRAAEAVLAHAELSLERHNTAQEHPRSG